MSVKKVSGFIQFMQEELKYSYPASEIREFANIIFEYLLGFTKTDILIKGETDLNENQIKFLNNSIERLKKQEPIQYITGETEFLDLKLKVTTETLIPRPETEELVMWISEHIKSDSCKILDIGTGSGCIALGLKSINKGVIVEGWDVNKRTLETAKSNAKLNRLDAIFLQVDIFAFDPDNNYKNKFDIIVSNPPYVRESEKKLMLPNVLDYEPHLALFVKDDNPLIFYREIARKAKSMLKQNGYLFFEINEAFGKETSELLKSEGYTEVEVKKDINGKDRMLKGKLT
ncbi:MAG: peptide chain release factor N(5)-glutamine methyltransferase [Chlorobi bacterium]|nr:peptide chain release factor N(5)-glutamine methyltransferase [Chlorobiota bacterium]